MRWVLVMAGLSILVAATMLASFLFTCSYELATAAFTGMAVVAAIMAYRAQDKQHAQIMMDARRSQMWESFNSMMQLSESRRPSDALVSTLNVNLKALALKDLNEDEELLRVLNAQWPVVEYWIVIGSWCNLMFTKDVEHIASDRTAIATLLVGAIGSDHMSALVEYAVRSSKSSFYPLIFIIWLFGGVRDIYKKDPNDRATFNAVEQNIKKYAQLRADS